LLRTKKLSIEYYFLKHGTNGVKETMLNRIKCLVMVGYLLLKRLLKTNDFLL